ncbi:hypothetical protein BST81_16880 [Leptolyngbya sp. 'hensonii']|nr:hypothetical protein BST81_16880 [Leptolyngbya sp. 'hensonii']
MVTIVYPALVRLSRHAKLQPLFSLGLLLGLISALVFGVLVHPAEAQFFQGTEDFVSNKLLQGVDNAEALKKIFSFIINIIRFLFILYMVFSVVQVIQALRRDEDWGKLAQIPLMVFVAATVTDIAAGFILPK